MQEDIENEAIALIVKTSKLTANTLNKTLGIAYRQIQKTQNKTLHGRQSVGKLMKHGGSTSTIPLTGDTRLFDRIAHKWNVDYSFHRTGKNKYLLLFKSGQTDAITACFKDYTKKYVEKENEKRLPIREQLERHNEHSLPEHSERERTREAARADR